jgi:type IV pilus assembly protein PilN
MARINLLPWRAELRKERQREFLTIAAGSAVLMLAVVGYVHIHINGLIENQQGRNSYLKTEIEAVEKKINEIKDLENKKQQLIARMRIIEQLQGNRPEIVHRFDELVNIVPEGLYLTSLSQSGKQITMEGAAQSNARVSALMRGLDGSGWYASPGLEIIETSEKKEGSSRTFKLKVDEASVQEK